MSNTIKTLIIILFFVVGIYVCLSIIPRLAKSIRRKVIMFRVKNDCDTISDSFLKEDHPGKFFVEMISVGLLRSIKTINHGEEFPDDRQTKTFRQFGTSAISNALDEIGEGV